MIFAPVRPFCLSLSSAAAQSSVAAVAVAVAVAVGPVAVAVVVTLIAAEEAVVEAAAYSGVAACLTGHRGSSQLLAHHCETHSPAERHQKLLQHQTQLQPHQR